MVTTLVQNQKELTDKVNSIDMSQIAYTLLNQEETQSWGFEKVQEQISLYLKFLILVALFPKASLVPTKETDKVWHTHILSTVKYTADCQIIFGAYLHHTPTIPFYTESENVELQNNFDKTCQLFNDFFGVNYSSQQNVIAVCESHFTSSKSSLVVCEPHFQNIAVCEPHISKFSS
jgi:hypothetical protein